MGVDPSIGGESLDREDGDGSPNLLSSQNRLDDMGCYTLEGGTQWSSVQTVEISNNGG